MVSKFQIEAKLKRPFINYGVGGGRQVAMSRCQKTLDPPTQGRGQNVFDPPH